MYFMNIDSRKQLGVVSRHFPHFLLEQKSGSISKKLWEREQF
jgi:hypothetical protein